MRQFHHRYSTGRRQALVNLIARGIEEGDFRADLDADLATIALLGTISTAGR